MKQYFILLSFLLGGLLANSQNLDLDWVVTYGGPGFSEATAIATDSEGNIFTTGVFSSTVDFDPGPGQLDIPSLGAWDMFIQKLNPHGDLIWAKGIGIDAGYNVWAKDIAVNSHGEIWITGHFRGEIDFDPDSGTEIMASNGADDIFVLKLDSSGAYKWSESFGGPENDRGWGIAIDQNDNCFLTGEFYGAVDFDPGPNGNLIGGVERNLFLLKMSEQGTHEWAYAIEDASGFSLSLGPNDNIVVTGEFFAETDFDPSPSSIDLVPHREDDDVLIASFNSDGSYRWGVGFGTIGYDWGKDVVIDEDGNVYVLGKFEFPFECPIGEEWLDFDYGSGQEISFSKGLDDIFLEKLDSNGVFQWVYELGGVGYDRGEGITLDKDGNIFITGYVSDSATFDSIGTLLTLHSNGERDILMQKLDPNGNVMWTKTVGGGRLDQGWDVHYRGSDESILFSGLFNDTVDFDFGLGMNEHIAQGISGQYDAFLLKLGACNTSFSSITDTFCGSFTSPSGIWNWSNSGSYSDTIKNANGCDSIISLSLTAFPAGSALTMMGDSLMSEAPFGDFQWLNCVDMSLIQGANDPLYVLSGDTQEVAVVVSFEGCTDTSACVQITDRIEESISGDIAIYPNPTDSKLFIDQKVFKGAYTISLINASGQLVFEQSVAAGSISLDLEFLATGLYHILLKNAESVRHLRFIKN